MEVTKQKMRCAVAEDPCYPCKHPGEGRVSQLRGEEVTAASPGGCPQHRRWVPGGDPGWAEAI